MFLCFLACPDFRRPTACFSHHELCHVFLYYDRLCNLQPFIKTNISYHKLLSVRYLVTTMKEIIQIENWFQELRHCYTNPNHMLYVPLELVCGEMHMIQSCELEKV